METSGGDAEMSLTQAEGEIGEFHPKMPNGAAENIDRTITFYFFV